MTFWPFELALPPNSTGPGHDSKAKSNFPWKIVRDYLTDDDDDDDEVDDGDIDDSEDDEVDDGDNDDHNNDDVGDDEVTSGVGELKY